MVARLIKLHHSPLSDFLAVQPLTRKKVTKHTTSVSFRIMLCESLGRYYSASSESAQEWLKSDRFAVRVLNGFLPTLPSAAGKDAGENLAKYCIICGFLFRGLLVADEVRREELRVVQKAVNDAITRRREWLEWKRESKEVRDVVDKEDKMLRLVAQKMRRM
jgi:hypothetical protein